MKSIFTLLLSFLLIHSMDAQTWEDIVLKEAIYSEAVRKGDTFFENRFRGKGSGYSQYMRWKENTEYHLGPDGKIQNRASYNYQAYKQVTTGQSGSRESHGNWENLGPFDYSVEEAWSQGGIGRINCIGFHPTNTQIFWVGTPAGGVWKTTNGGSSWSPLTDGFASIGVSGIAVHPQDPTILYILTGDGDGSDTPSVGVFKSTNGGLSWEPTYSFIPMDSMWYGYTIAIHPNHPDTILVGMRDVGIFRSQNGGASWLLKEEGTTVWDIEFVPGSPDTIYAASNNELLKSTDGGVTWASIDDPNFPNTYARMAIAISPQEPANVYALFGGNTGVNGTFRGLFKSTDYGGIFSMQSNTPCILDETMSGDNTDNQAGYDLALIVDPQNDTRIFTGGINVWKSDNSGVNWSRETWWTRSFHPIDPYVHSDFHNFYFNNNLLYVVNDGGIYTTADLGNSWTEFSAGLCLMQFYEMDVLNSSYMGGSQDNGTNESEFTDPQASHIEGGDGFGCVWHTGDNSIQYLTTQNSIVRRQASSNIYIWVENDGFWNTDIKMHTTDPNYFFFSKQRELFRANQNVFPWDFNFDSLNTIDFIPDWSIRGFIQGVGSSDDTMYVLHRTTFLRSENINAATPEWDSLPNPAIGNALLSDVVISPTSAKKVWVSCSGFAADHKMYYSSTGGASWTNITGSLPNVPVYCLAYSPGTQDGIYIGTDIGIFYKEATMSDWIYYSNFMPNVPVRDILVSNGYLYAGTYGRGMWRSPVHSCPTSLTLTPSNDNSDPNNMGRQEYSATQSITSTRIIQSPLADIHYNAGNYIDLNLGFWVKAGSQLYAKIDGCPD